MHYTNNYRKPHGKMFVKCKNYIEDKLNNNKTVLLHVDAFIFQKTSCHYGLAKINKNAY